MVLNVRVAVRLRDGTMDGDGVRVRDGDRVGVGDGAMYPGVNVGDGVGDTPHLAQFVLHAMEAKRRSFIISIWASAG